MVRTTLLAALIAAVLGVSWQWGSYVAGGSDSSCYATQAVRWSRVLAHPFTASVQTPDPLALAAPWPDAVTTFTPTGHVPSPVVPGAVVPICPAGLPLLMALLYLAGGTPVMFAAVPLLGVVLIAATATLGARFTPRVGLAAAALTAASPVFLYQVLQPMSDVPAAAFWILAVASATASRRGHAVRSGLATSAALLVRPNLVPLGLVLGLFLLFRPEQSWRRRGRAALVYAAASAPGCLAVAAIHNALYGSPLASGYGSVESLFALEHVAPNLARYGSWLVAALTPAVGLAALAPILLPGPLSTLMVALFVVNLLLYLPYVVFSDWSYLRFLLPTLPLVFILMAAAVESVIVRIEGRGVAPGSASARRRLGLASAAVTIVLGLALVLEARDRHAFELHDMEARFVQAGRFVASRLPANALVITDYESASVPFYSGRRTLTWSALDPEWLGRAIAFTRERGFEPYLLFESWEEPGFRRRFAGSDFGALDWPPVAEIGVQVRVYRIADRARYRAGEAVQTEYIR